MYLKTDVFADFLLHIAMLLFYWVLFFLVGLCIFAVVYCACIILSRIFCVAQDKRKYWSRTGIVVGLLLGTIGCIPAYVAYIDYYNDQKNAPREAAAKNLHHELQKDGRENYWPAGTIHSLEQWVNAQDVKFRDEMHKELAGRVSQYINNNKVDVDESDLVMIAWLANLPPESWGYSDHVVASCRAYLRLRENGLSDVGYPERFARSPGHHKFAAQMDYVTYLTLGMRRCTMQANENCAKVFTAEMLDKLETMPDVYSLLTWSEKEVYIPPLRQALGYTDVNQNSGNH